MLELDELCVLGLVHEHPTWLDPLQPRVFDWSREGKWAIACADMHPSHDFRLRHDGKFLGGPTTSFDVFIEQLAAVWGFCEGHAVENVVMVKGRDPELRAEILGRSTMRRIDAASDEYTSYLKDETYLIADDREHQELRDGWVRLHASE
ncbi:hypothetical protein ACNOYE_07055 [Nannocystaceae bacterium ST9]